MDKKKGKKKGKKKEGFFLSKADTDIKQIDQVQKEFSSPFQATPARYFHGTQNGDGKTTYDSETQPVDATRVSQGILISSRVEEDFKVSIVVSSNSISRPKTKVQGQGDHITGYLVIIIAIVETIRDQEGIVAAIENINNIAKSFSIKVDKTPKVHGSGFRKNVISELNNATNIFSTITDDNVTNIIRYIDDSMRYRKLSILANHLTNIAQKLINKLQLRPNAVAFSMWNKDKKKLEGSNMRDSVRALQAVEALVELESLDNNENFSNQDIVDIKNKLCNDSSGVKYGLRKLLGKDFDKFVAKLNKIEKPKQFLTILKAEIKIIVSNYDEIAKMMGFMYDFDRILKLDKTKIKFDEKKGENIEEKIKEKYGKKINYTVKNNDITVKRNDFNELIETIKDFFIVFEIAFPKLAKYVGYEEIKKQFIINKVIKGSGWNKCKYEDINSCLTQSKSSAGPVRPK